MVLSIITNFISFLKFLQKFLKELEKNYFTVINGFIQQKQAQIIAAAKLTYEVLTFFFPVLFWNTFDLTIILHINLLEIFNSSNSVLQIIIPEHWRSPN